MHTPSLNAFMKESLVLTQSHVQQAVCSPSRWSVLLGRRPDTTHVYDLITNARHVGCSDCLTIPGMFKEAGYFALGVGKIFHDGAPGNYQDYVSWTDLNGTTTYKNWFLGDDHYRDHSFKIVDEERTGLCQDSQVRDKAVYWLRNLSARTDATPWFLAVGFRKPHLSFAAPKQFYDLYHPDDTKLAANPYAPVDMPEIAYASYELQSYPDVAKTGFKGRINETLVDWKAKQEVRGYQAGVSYTDHNIGAVLDELKRLGHWDDTIIVFWGDHGWKLGQHGAWAKHTNFHHDTNTPLMLRVPGLTDGGKLSRALVEHVDIMATLAEAAGLEPLETCPETKPWTVRRCTEGKSFLKLARDPTLPWKSASYSQYPRAGGKIMGYSMNTDKKFRFTAWVEFDPSTNTSSFTMRNKRCGLELYDHNDDPGENHNLAYQAKHQDLVKQLFEQLQAGWRVTASSLQEASLAYI